MTKNKPHSNEQFKQGRKRWNTFDLFSIPQLTGITTLLLIFVSLLAIFEIEEVTENEVGDWLSTTLNTAHSSILSWSTEHAADAEILATSPKIMKMARELSLLPRTRQALLSSSIQEELQAFLAPTLRHKDYLGYLLVSPDGYILSDSQAIETGKDGPPEILELIKTGHTVITLPLFYDLPIGDGPRTPTPTIFVGTPIRIEDGRIIAHIVFRIDPRQGFSNIFNRARTGRTGETYAFDRRGILLNESRFDKELQQIGLLNAGMSSLLRVSVRDPGVDLTEGQKVPLTPEEWPLTHMASSAIRSKRGIDVEGYRDYRGVKVIGAWIWEEDLGFGIATEWDIREAYRPLRTTKLILFILMATSLSLLLLLALFSVLGRRRLEQSERNLRQINRELDTFAYTVSHDLRTPLTPIIGYADFLNESYRDKLDQQALDSLSEISASGRRMLALMEDLLNLAKIGEVERPANPLNTRDIVQEVVDGLNAQLSQAGAKVIIDELPFVRLPKAFLIQIFDNFIGNASRYGCRPGDVIEVGGERNGKKVRLFVRDHGPGVPPEESQRIFEVFYRGSTGRNIKGTGIGLATVRKIANLYKGRAGVEETPGGGSTFWVEIVDILGDEPPKAD